MLYGLRSVTAAYPVQIIRISATCFAHARRWLSMGVLLSILGGLCSSNCPAADDAADDPVAPWRNNVRIAPVSAVPGRHTIHSYYVCNPESPDGRSVLYFASTHPAGYVGQICVLDRESGKETVLAENVHTEDAHRAACQQWLSNGRSVAYHEVVDGRWRVMVVDVATGTKTVVAEDRQLGFGRGNGDLLPLYGCHWNPGAHRDLELWDATTGQLHTAVRIAEVEKQYGDWLKKQFNDKPTSIFFPVISPDQTRVFFKMAAGNGGNEYMSKNASQRQGLVCYSLEQKRLTWMREKWGHPAWHPDSRRIAEMGNFIFDAEGAPLVRIPDLPNLRGSHPSVSPDGRLLVTDGLSQDAGGPPKEWGVMVADFRGGTGRFALLHSFDNSRGARSWRRSDPHPAFSADGRRIYYNVSDGEHTRLFVAERGAAKD